MPRHHLGSSAARLALTLVVPGLFVSGLVVSTTVVPATAASETTQTSRQCHNHGIAVTTVTRTARRVHVDFALSDVQPLEPYQYKVEWSAKGGRKPAESGVLRGDGIATLDGELALDQLVVKGHRRVSYLLIATSTLDNTCGHFGVAKRVKRSG